MISVVEDTLKVFIKFLQRNLISTCFLSLESASEKQEKSNSFNFYLFFIRQISFEIPSFLSILMTHFVDPTIAFFEFVVNFILYQNTGEHVKVDSFLGRQSRFNRFFRLTLDTALIVDRKILGI